VGRDRDSDVERRHRVAPVVNRLNGGYASPASRNPSA
jgi:hypothetical protein